MTKDETSLVERLDLESDRLIDLRLFAAHITHLLMMVCKIPGNEASMGTTKTSATQEARRRAREAKARADAERIEREKQVEEVVTAYYTAALEAETLREDLDAAVRRGDEAMVQLLDLGESRERVALLTGASTREVGGARRRLAAKSDADASESDGPTGSEPLGSTDSEQ